MTLCTFSYVKPGFHMIVAIAENGCDVPDGHMETPVFFLVTIVTIRIATIVEIETRRSWRSSDDREFNGNHFCGDRYARGGGGGEELPYEEYMEVCHELGSYFQDKNSEKGMSIFHKNSGRAIISVRNSR